VCSNIRPLLFEFERIGAGERDTIIKEKVEVW